VGVITGQSLLNCKYCSCPYKLSSRTEKKEHEKGCKKMHIYCKVCGKGKGSRFSCRAALTTHTKNYHSVEGVEGDEEDEVVVHVGVITGKSLLNCKYCGCPYKLSSRTEKKEHEKGCKKMHLYCKMCGKWQGQGEPIPNHIRPWHTH
jgi:hypothetical protein